ncbi:MAG: 50S ribosomal protein L22 [Eubacteriales bacterium]|nr:50S ribosomal protein L22 [Eubacteriales bacterium]
MSRKVMSKEYMQTHREDLRAAYYAQSPKSRKARLLSKKERKELGIGKDEGHATAKYVRIAPSKVNIVLKLIRGKSLKEAEAILRYTNKVAAPVLQKLLASATANAVNNNELSAEKLYVAEAYANEGPTMKRFQPRARGGAGKILKRSSHISITVREKQEA